MPEHHTEKVLVSKYCPQWKDGQWHKVSVPLKDLIQPAGFDPKHVAEMQFFNTGNGDGSFFIDDLAFEDGVTARTTVKHSFACTDYTQGKVFIISDEGKLIWDYEAENCNDLWVLPNGNLLFNTGHGVKEVTRDKEVVFNYESKSEIYACQRLANGNTFIGECNSGFLLEVAPNGQIVKKIKLLPEGADGGHGFMRNARKLENGNYLVCQEEDKLVVEYRPDGKLVNSFHSPGKCFAAIRLKNGNTLISDGSACSVREVNNKGKEAWKISKDDFPELKLNWLTGIQELPNGNYLICNWLGHGKYGEGIPMFEINKGKKIVWYFTDNNSTKSLSNATVMK
jgi:hypothetical protein